MIDFILIKVPSIGVRKFLKGARQLSNLKNNTQQKPRGYYLPKLTNNTENTYIKRKNNATKLQKKNQETSSHHPKNARADPRPLLKLKHINLNKTLKQHLDPLTLHWYKTIDTKIA